MRFYVLYPQNLQKEAGAQPYANTKVERKLVHQAVLCRKKQDKQKVGAAQQQGDSRFAARAVPARPRHRPEAHMHRLATAQTPGHPARKPGSSRNTAVNTSAGTPAFQCSFMLSHLLPCAAVFRFAVPLEPPSVPFKNSFGWMSLI